MSQDPLNAALSKTSGEITLALSFWDVFRKEAASICKEAKDFDGRPWIEVEEKIIPIEDFPRSVHELRLQCGCFEFAAILEPMSLAIVYASHLIGMESVFDDARLLISRGLVSFSRNGDDYMTHGLPPIQDLPEWGEACGYGEFWQRGKEFARWACGSISLQRLAALKDATSAGLA